MIGTLGRALVIALRAVGLVIAAILVTHILLVVLELDVASTFAATIGSVAHLFSLGLSDLLALGNRRATVATNYGLATVAWLTVTNLVPSVVGLARRRATSALTAPTSSTQAAPGPNDPETTGPRKMRRSSRLALIGVGVLSLLETAGFAGTYFLYSSHYVTTDNAQVDGDRIDINAPATGTIASWNVGEGTSLRTGEVVGRIKILDSSAQPQMTVKSPGQGTVAVNNAIQGEYVTAGTELATAYDFSNIYATARIADTEIGGVHPGQLVDISVDSSPDTPMTGLVEVIQSSVASDSTIYPSASAGDPSNPQKVDQYVPVKIAFTNTGGLRLVPGMNITVHIHKD